MPHSRCVQVYAFCMCVSVHKARSIKAVVFHQVSSCSTLTEPLNQKVMEKSKHTNPTLLYRSQSWLNKNRFKDKFRRASCSSQDTQALAGRVHRTENEKQWKQSHLVNICSEKQFHWAAMLLKKRDNSSHLQDFHALLRLVLWSCTKSPKLHATWWWCPVSCQWNWFKGGICF